VSSPSVTILPIQTCRSKTLGPCRYLARPPVLYSRYNANTKSACTPFGASCHGRASGAHGSPVTERARRGCTLTKLLSQFGFRQSASRAASVRHLHRSRALTGDRLAYTSDPLVYGTLFHRSGAMARMSLDHGRIFNLRFILFGFFQTHKPFYTFIHRHAIMTKPRFASAPPVPRPSKGAADFSPLPLTAAPTPHP
jgi:hypothetical protein